MIYYISGLTELSFLEHFLLRSVKLSTPILLKRKYGNVNISVYASSHNKVHPEAAAVFTLGLKIIGTPTRTKLLVGVLTF